MRGSLIWSQVWKYLPGHEHGAISKRSSAIEAKISDRTSMEMRNQTPLYPLYPLKHDSSSMFLSLQPVSVPLGLDQLLYLGESSADGWLYQPVWLPSIVSLAVFQPLLGSDHLLYPQFALPQHIQLLSQESSFLPLTKAVHVAFLFQASHILLSKQTLQSRWDITTTTQGFWDGRWYKGLAFLLSWCFVHFLP